MIHTVQVELSVPDSSPVTATDPRILLAAQQVLLGRTGVMQAPDLLTVMNGVPVFVVAMDDSSGTGRYFVSSLIEQLVQDSLVTIVFAADGGDKVCQVLLTFEVGGL